MIVHGTSETLLIKFLRSRSLGADTRNIKRDDAGAFLAGELSFQRDRSITCELEML